MGVAALVDALDLMKAEVRVEGDVLDHEQVRVEPKFVAAAPLRFFLDRGEERWRLTSAVA